MQQQQQEDQDQEYICIECDTREVRNESASVLNFILLQVRLVINRELLGNTIFANNSSRVANVSNHQLLAVDQNRSDGSGTTFPQIRRLV